jgi:hypothetical protein
MLINNLENTNKIINQNNRMLSRHFSILKKKTLFKIKIYKSKRKYKVLEYLKAKTKLLRIFMEFLTIRKILNLISLLRKLRIKRE